MKRLIPWRVSVGLAAVATLSVTLVVSSSGGASGPSPADQAAAAAPVREVLPGADASLKTTPSGGVRLSITAPPGALTLPGTDDPSLTAPAPTSDANIIPAAQLAWRAQLAAGLVASRNSAALGFDVDLPDAKPDPEQRSYLHMSLRRRPGSPTNTGFDRLGTVPLAQARGQLSSNLEILTAALPANTVKSSRVVVIPVDAAHGLFALETDLKVAALETLKPRLGDVVSGLATGLIGDERAVVEGLAINVVDERGQRAAWWRTTRAGIGMGVPSPVFASVPVLSVDRAFPNLTGGSPTIDSVSSQAASGG